MLYKLECNDIDVIDILTNEIKIKFNILTFCFSLGGLVSFSAGPLLPSNLAFKPFNKMWRSPLHQNRFLNRIKSERINEREEDFVTENNVENSLDGLKNDVESLSLTSFRKRSTELLRLERLNIDRFRRHRLSLPNNNVMLRSVTDEEIEHLQKFNKSEKANTFSNGNTRILSDPLSNEISNVKAQEITNNHLDNEILGRYNQALSSKRSMGISLRFPWSKSVASNSLPSSPMKTLQSQHTFDGDIKQMKNHHDSQEIHSKGRQNSTHNDVTTMSQVGSLDSSVLSIVEENVPHFDIGAFVQPPNELLLMNHTSNDSMDSSNSDSLPSNLSELDNSLEFEDNEDLESTIRKLRHLLSQTKSDENSSGDSTVHPIDLIETPSISIIESSEIMVPNKDTVGENFPLFGTMNSYVDEPDAALDGRLFYNIRITDVDITELPKKTKATKNGPKLCSAQSDNCLADASSLVFSISYDGMYIEEVLPQINNDSTAECASSPINKRPQINSFKYTLEKEQVKRKYQEFVILQKHIENKISVNSDIWSLKENSTKDKIMEKFHTKFGNQKSSFNINEMVDIQERKDYLEKWLVDICGNSALCHTPELKEFLSYPVDDTFAVARKSFRNTKNDKVLSFPL